MIPGQAAKPEKFRYQKLVTAERLAVMDGARDSGIATSLDWLSEELRGLRAFIAAKGIVRIEEQTRPVILWTVPDFVAWAQHRYPAAGLTE